MHALPFDHAIRNKQKKSRELHIPINCKSIRNNAYILINCMDFYSSNSNKKKFVAYNRTVNRAYRLTCVRWQTEKKRARGELWLIICGTEKKTAHQQQPHDVILFFLFPFSTHSE